MRKLARLFLILPLVLLAPAPRWSRAEQLRFDVLVKGGTLYDGAGGAPVRADVGIQGDRIVAIGALEVEILGEGTSMGPLNDNMKREIVSAQAYWASTCARRGPSPFRKRCGG
jgi:hypothetical protein